MDGVLGTRQSQLLHFSGSPAAEQLQDILGEEDEAPNPTLFTEMDTLQHDGDQMEWKESARWIKFEEKVEEGGERWSKPHVSTLSLHSLFELRACLQTGTVLLDLDSGSLPQIIDDVIEKQIENGLLRPELRERVSYVLLRKHRHQTKKPIHRSLADIGKSVSTTNRSSARSPSGGPTLHRSTEDLRIRQSTSYGHLCHAQSRSMNDISHTPNTDQRKNKFMKKIPKDSEASNVLVGEVDFLDQPFIAFVRLIQSAMLGGVTEVPVPTRFLFILLGPSGRAKSYNEIGRAIATLMVDDLFSDVAYKARNREDLIAGIDEFLDEVIVLPPGEWDPNIRIEPPKKVPSADKRKSVFSLAELGQMNGSAGGGGASAGGGGGGGGPGGSGAGGVGSGDETEMPAMHEIGEELIWTGRFFGGLRLDVKRKLPWFPSDFYDGFHIQSISAILFIYLGCITNAITFGGLLGDATDNYQGVMESFLGTAMAGALFCLFSGQPLIILSSTGPILIFEKLLFDFSKANGLDYMEFRFWIGLHSAIQCLILVATDASFIIKYITRFTEEGFSTLISFIFIYDAIKKMIGAFSYYPINTDFKPDSITTYKCECVAPDTALDWSLLSKKECLSYGGRLLGDSCRFIPDLALMSFILFFGTYSMTLTLKKFKFSRYFPTKVRTLVADFSIVFSILLFCGIDACFGLQTPKLHVPNVIKCDPCTSVMLFWGSILMAFCSFMGLPWYVTVMVISSTHIDSLKMETEISAPGEQSQVPVGQPTRPDRGWFVAPFGKNPWWVYPASILPALLVTILIFMDQQITAVIVNRKENKLKPTRPDRGWFVAPFGKNPWWVYPASILPALLVTILIFMDQQITAVIVNRKENKLKKAAGYHLDLFWVGILMALCSFTGLPWYVAATVISIAHIDSLKMETETSAPGEQPQFLGVREQRVTGIMVFILTGISVFLAPILKICSWTLSSSKVQPLWLANVTVNHQIAKCPPQPKPLFSFQYIPMPVLYGVFLYMGVASLNGIQFWERCKLFLMPAKHQPDHAFLRHVPLRRIHLFTLVQILCLALLWILKSTMAAIIFPVMILGLIIVRRLLDLIFSQHDLAWIDNILPEKEKQEPDKKKKRRKGAHENTDEEPQFLPPSVIKIPMESVPSDPQNGIQGIARKRSSSWSYSF
ncbi:Electrogenic sodium bicarbonate cotransporter 4 [Cricetulus griseus]|uniref:Anion exchange protein n=1 Tax=Cricetulus griseus TaxID=10029 RepID=G3I4A8_CRIGR|nr:Electrogenic sodium bicarbonate cotransporter 4 [Cricetulus griseus]